MKDMKELDSDLRQEYRIRKQMLIERAKVIPLNNSFPPYGMAHMAHCLVEERHPSLKRRFLLQVLLQSFLQADRLKEKGLAEEASALAGKYASSLKAEPEVSLSDIFTARQGEFSLRQLSFDLPGLTEHHKWKMLI